MNSRDEVIERLLTKHPDSFFVFSNGLTSREAVQFFPEDRCFYLLHGMGETLSVGVGLALAKPDLHIVVVEGDGSALMGLASWSLMPLDNLQYYVLANGVHETTGGQGLMDFPIVPHWCTICSIARGQEGTPNPPPPHKIINKFEARIAKK